MGRARKTSRISDNVVLSDTLHNRIIPLDSDHKDLVRHCRTGGALGIEPALGTPLPEPKGSWWSGQTRRELSVGDELLRGDKSYIETILRYQSEANLRPGSDDPWCECELVLTKYKESMCSRVTRGK